MLSVKYPNKCPTKAIKTGASQRGIMTVNTQINSVPKLDCIINSNKLKLTYDAYNGAPIISPSKSFCNYQIGGYWTRWRGNNNKSTGISNYVGPTLGNVIYEDSSLSQFTYVSPVIDKYGNLYVCGGDIPVLYCYNPDITLKWTFDASSYSYNDIAFRYITPSIGCDGTIYLCGGSSTTRLYAINPNGTLKWVSGFISGSSYNFNVIIVREIIYLGTSNGVIEGFDKNGNSVFYKHIPFTDFDGWCVSADDVTNTLYIGGGYFNNFNSYYSIYGINLNTGSIIWEYQVYDNYRIQNSTPAIDGDYIYVGSEEGRILKINRTSGLLEYQSDVYSPMDRSSPIVDTEYVYAADFNGNIIKLNKIDLTEVWIVNIPGTTFNYGSPIMDNNGNIYICTSEQSPNYVYCIDKVSGSIQWYNTIDTGTVFSIYTAPAIGPNNLLYTTSLTGIKVFGN